MRYDTKAEMYSIELLEDGMGGYEEIEVLQDTLMVNKSSMNFSIAEKLFGKVSLTALNCVVNKNLTFSNKAQDVILIDNKKYGIVTYKTYRNKTHLYLEVMDNE